jgi:hypothetical protein
VLRDCAGQWLLRTIEGRRFGLDKLILPTLGNLLVDEIECTDVTDWLDGLNDARRSKDRATSVPSAQNMVSGRHYAA